MKVNITVADELMNRIDKYSKENYMSRSGFVSMACTQYLNQVDILSTLTSLKLAMDKIAESGQIDDEARHQLDDFVRMSGMIVNK